MGGVGGGNAAMHECNDEEPGPGHDAGDGDNGGSLNNSQRRTSAGGWGAARSSVRAVDVLRKGVVAVPPAVRRHALVGTRFRPLSPSLQSSTDRAVTAGA